MRYATAPAFRRALEDHLKARAEGVGARIARDRKRVVFDRFLARLVATAPGAWALKGGFALDLRLSDRARSTRDVDLAWAGDEEELLETLITAASTDQSDFFEFTVERTGDAPERFGGAHRFRIAATLAGRLFETFVLDVGHAEVTVDQEMLPTSDLLGFARIPPVTVPVTPLAVQAAEKLHAYIRMYEGGRASTRVKDLVDLALIAHEFVLDAGQLRSVIDGVFAARRAKGAPEALPRPPEQWRAPFRTLATALGLDLGLDAGHQVAAAALDPVLKGRVRSGTWDPRDGHWTDVPG